MQEYTETRPMAQANFSIGATDLRRTETHGHLLADDITCATANNSGCDLPLAVSMFADVKAQRIESNHLSLRQLQDRLNSTTASDKDSLPLVKLGTFGDARSDKGSLRHDGNLLSVSGVEGDYDAGVVSPQEAAERLRQASIAALIYTTPSHGQPGKGQRWRVLAPWRAPQPLPNGKPFARD